MITRTCASSLGLVAALALAACSDGGDADGVGEAPQDEVSIAPPVQALLGRVLFDLAFPGTNGRACGTCHVPGEHTTLRPAGVTARLAHDPYDPLFNVIDADDPTAAALTFDHLRAGLVRVSLPMADNIDVVDADGKVVTGSNRTIQVWRAVPTVENTAYTAPYQLDGRIATLPEQALQALINHSRITYQPDAGLLGFLSAYESTVFSSPRAAAVAAAILAGVTPPDPQPVLAPGSDAQRGQGIFQQACAPCHGGPRGNQILDEAAHDMLFPVLNQDGSVSLATLSDDTVVPAQVRHDHAGDRFLNIGIAGGTYLGQVGLFPNFTGVSFPQYRVRFYADASRQTPVVDLPPPPPLVGPNLIPQAFSVDPGRAITSGDPADFEAFDVPQLRGIKHTAPYFHDNSAPDLATMVDIYSRFILRQLPSLNLPLVNPPEGPGLPPESLSPAQKKQLIAYLERI